MNPPRFEKRTARRSHARIIGKSRTVIGPAGHRFFKEDMDMTLHRMRTIPEALAEIRALDERSAVTPYCIRTLCKAGRVRCIYTGRKILVDLDSLLAFLNEGESDLPAQARAVGGE